MDSITVNAQDFFLRGVGLDTTGDGQGRPYALESRRISNTMPQMENAKTAADLRIALCMQHCG